MRPVELTIEGLRSFRAPQTISFTGRDYIAVIGDTGAGKSSILEALTFALYGRTTFSGRGLQELVNASSTRLRVAFTFDVQDGRWEVARTLRRDGKGKVQPGQVSLRKVSADGEALESYEQARVVNDKVEAILGLDVEAFLRTVVLPQGQFSRLLVEDQASDRANVLRQIWRTDELTEAGRHVDEAIADLLPLVGRVEQALEGEPEDAASHLAELERAAATAQEARDGAIAQESAVEAAVAEHAQLLRRLADLATLDGLVGRWDGGAASGLVEEIAGAERSAQAALDDLVERSDAAAAALSAIPADDADGLPSSDVARYRTVLGGLPARARARDRASAHVMETEERLKELTELAEEAAAKLGAADRDAAPTRAQADAAAKSARVAQTKLQSAMDALVAARSAESAAADAAAAAEDAEADLARTEAELVAAEEAAGATDGAYEQARDALDAIRRASAAAEVSHGLHGGDPCPVCQQTLPEKWKAPRTPGLKSAETAERTAARRRDERTRAVVTLTERLGTAQRDLAVAVDRNKEATASAKAARRTLTKALGQPADLTAADDALLAGLAAAATEADQVLQQATTASEKAMARLSSAGQEDATAAANRTAAAEALDQARSALGSAGAAYDEEVGRLPDELRPADADLEREIARIDAQLAERVAALDERAAQRAELQAALDQLRAERDQLDEERSALVEKPGQRVWTDLVTHHGALERAAEGVGTGVFVEPLGSQPSPIDLPAQVRRHEAATAEIRSALSRSSAEAADRQAAVEQEVGDLAERLDLSTRDLDTVRAAIRDRRTDAEVEYRTHEEARRSFEARMPFVAELRDASAELVDRHRALADLSAALKDGAFPKWLTLRRSRLLLVHASRLLSEMTADRYAFADLEDVVGQWSVFDRDNGQARSPSSLSGGEKFVASLALALGMVEMMGRQGGRIESLFLDEGFGALDRTNLDAAVEALASVATKGRMVAVITHLRAVAEQIEDVLTVTREPVGSVVTWLDSGARREMVDASLEPTSGLLE